jgi:3'-phosphoadenosine 5'-phosphosulfate sulfotransferase (PAPS reductase)/FAD synthetase
MLTEISTDFVAEWNEKLKDYTPQEIILWACSNLSGLFQTTAFGGTPCRNAATGLVILDIIALNKQQVPIIFIDTLYLS